MFGFDPCVDKTSLVSKRDQKNIYRMGDIIKLAMEQQSQHLLPCLIRMNAPARLIHLRIRFLKMHQLSKLHKLS